MGSPADGALRVIRTLAITAVIVGLAATAHVAGGAAVPRPIGVAGLALVTAYVCAWVARRRLSAVAILALLGIGQWALHHAFDLLEAPVCEPAVAGHAGHAAGHVAAAGGCPPAGAAVLLATPHAGAPSWVMLAAHVGATAVTALLLAAGERALWALCGLLATFLPLVLRAAVPVAAPARQTPAVVPVRRPRRAALLRTSPRRGPPPVSTRPLARLAS